ncbi:thiol reductant ABC exporter subunit CydC [Gemelliphila palaticanis]|uniref:Thiol reductant ABC exporter subunit CydC n=1 Tax=Gemelliphila palaticanis TaxID=81950 RepID=A0ABX2SYW5_9BACL|nr:thiol reductant ABC exporter subunit CydC [Gemella palaticanis]MBF0715297.1 thiol reductant ABC exporter subunit CydC [Gemella palaticanis]NYS47227.1 thiol reductant ABC exporter subunit CydC [Gemella palaticanis]
MEKNSIIRKDINKNKSQMTLIIVLGLISVMSGAALMYVSGFLISKASLKIGNILMLQVPTVLTRTFSLSQSVFSYVQRLISHDLVLKIIEKMRSKVYKILEPMSLRLKKEYKSGDLLGLLSEDIENLQNIYLKSIFPSIISLLLYVIFITVMFGYDSSYALLATLFGIFIIFVIPFISLLVTKSNLQSMKHSKHLLYSNFTSAIFGVTDLVSSGKGEQFIDEYKKEEEKFLLRESKTKLFIHIREIVIQFLAATTVLLIIYSCKKMVINNTIENIYIASFCMIALSVMTVAAMTGDAISHIPAYQVSIDRVKDFYKNEEKFVDDKEEFIVSDYNNIITINDLHFSYNSGQEVLKGIDLNIKKGEKVAILGRSGVGKSTLFKLLTGTYKNYEGNISILGQEPSEKLLGSSISVLNQKPYLFDMTIKENMQLSTLGKNNVSDEEIESSLKKAQIYDLINDLPDKLDTSVYETGSRFSGGERQRIAFARTLIQNNDLLLLDEPTVGLDPKTETELLKTIFENSKDKTILWITHHLNSIQYMDRIIFIKDGKIEMDGSHDYLYKNNEKYRKLYDMDMGI